MPDQPSIKKIPPGFVSIDLVGLAPDSPFHWVARCRDGVFLLFEGRPAYYTGPDDWWDEDGGLCARMLTIPAFLGQGPSLHYLVSRERMKAGFSDELTEAEQQAAMEELRMDRPIPRF